MQAKIIIIIEKAEDGTLWGRVEYGDDLLTSAGNTIEELQDNFNEQLQGFYDLDPGKIKYEIKYDIGAFFDQYSALNISAIGEMAGINPSLMRHYKNGIKFPSDEQVKKIEDALHILGKQLNKISLVALQD